MNTPSTTVDEHTGPAADGFRWSRDTTDAIVRGRTCRVYRHRRTAVAQLLLDARHWGDRVHVVQGERRLTFAEHERAVARIAEHFRTLGVGAGDHVALFARNHAECTMAFWAAHCLGAVVDLCNAWWSAAELEGALDTVRPVLIVHDDDTEDRVPTGITGVSVTDLGPMLHGDSAPELPLPEVAEDDPALVLFTSGSTGAAKGVLLSQRSVVGNIHNLLLATHRLPGELDRDGAASVNMVTVPLFHLAGVQVMTAALVTGARLVYQDGRFNPAEVLRLIEQEQVTTWGAVPAMVTRVMEHENFVSADTSSVRSIPLGGSASTPAFRRTVQERFPNLKGGGAGSMYGLTEAGGLLAMGTSREISERPGCVGKLLPPIEVTIATPDADGNGEILVNCPGLMSGYVDPDLESLVDADGWLHTGDLGRVDADDYLYLSGRSKDIIIRGGENISCAHVAAALTTHPAVAEAIVVALPHEELGEQVAAAVTIRRGMPVSTDDLRAHAATTLGRFQIPTRWWLRNDMLPTSASGKVIRRNVEAMWLERGATDLIDNDN
ncbi:class I adenylate-forming enzyme family protein [Rhodococcus sp. NPDC127593]|uniref:class I adenylate-forming enzyme family protein n=1 Tax=Rhodococcus sp. NPDC127593 TaxID=3345404 RepID=UPI00363A27A7